MTDHQASVALALGRCVMLPGSHDKRFAREMGEAALLAKPQALSERQAAHLTRLAWRYRRQMPADLVPAEKPV